VKYRPVFRPDVVGYMRVPFPSAESTGRDQQVDFEIEADPN
jgi:hypothetical protein